MEGLGTAIIAGLAIGIAFIFLFIYYDNTSDKPHHLTIAIGGLSQQYTIGQKIDFAVTAKGYDHLCGNPSLKIVNRDSGKIIYENNDIFYLGLCDPDVRIVDENWNLTRLIGDNDSKDFTVKEAGNYRLMVNYGDKTVAQDFRIIKPQIVTVTIVKDAVLQSSPRNFEPKRIVVVLGINNTVRWINEDAVL